MPDQLRFVNHNDIVCQIGNPDPLKTWYSHPPTEIYIKPDGSIKRGNATGEDMTCSNVTFNSPALNWRDHDLDRYARFTN